MDKFDLSYSQSEKALKFTEDARTGLHSLKEAFDYVREKSYNDSYLSNYTRNTEWLMFAIKTGDVVPASHASEKAFIPSLKSSDYKFRLSRFTV